MIYFRNVVVSILIGAFGLGCGGDATTAVPDEVAAGRKLFQGSCAMCHGANGEGRPRLGRALISNQFVAALSDEELVEFLRVGRPADHPENEQGVAMPPRGGNPSLTDRDLALIVAYMRSLQ